MRLLLVLLAVPTIALAADAGSGQTTGPAAPAQSAPTTPPPAPVLAVSAPPSMPADPVNCRMSCASANYVCLAANDQSDCSPTWSRCVAACDNPDLKPDVSAAPQAQSMTSP